MATTTRKQLLEWAAQDRAAGHFATALMYERKARELVA